MARPKTPSKPAVSRQEFYQIQQQVHFEAYSGRRHFSTSNLAETLGLSLVSNRQRSCRTHGFNVVVTATDVRLFEG